MKQFKIEEEKTQAVINYLATCPYGQVYQLIALLMQLEEIKEKKDGI